MIAVLYGKDEFSAHEALAALTRELDSDGMLADNIVRVDGASARPDELLTLCQTLPFLSSMRLVVVEGLLHRFEPAGRGRRAGGARRRGKAQDLGEWEPLLEGLKTMPETTALVFLDGALDARNPLLAALAPLADVREFKGLAPSEVAAWINQRAARYGVQLQARAVAALAALVGTDLRLLDSEVQKLGTYAAGGQVSEEDVRSMVSMAREPNVFAMADAVVEGRAQDAAALLQRLLADGQAPQYLLTMIARQYRLLILAKELLERRVRAPEIATRLGVPSFVMQRLLKQAPVYTPERLRGAYRRILEADLSVKRGIYDDETALQLLAMELALGARGASPARGRPGYSRPPGGPGQARSGAGPRPSGRR